MCTWCVRLWCVCVCSLFVLTELTDYGNAGPHHTISFMQPIVAHGNEGIGDRGGEEQCIHSDHLYEAAEQTHRAVTFKQC